MCFIIEQDQRREDLVSLQLTFSIKLKDLSEANKATN